jgi:hypothetical protein
MKLSPSTVKHYAVETYWGMEVWSHPFLASALIEGVWLDSRGCCSVPRTEPQAAFGYETVWASRPIWTLWSRSGPRYSAPSNLSVTVLTVISSVHMKEKQIWLHLPSVRHIFRRNGRSC